MILKKLFYTELAYQAFYASCPEFCKTKNKSTWLVTQGPGLFIMKWGSFLTPPLDRQPVTLPGGSPEAVCGHCGLSHVTPRS